MGKLAFQCSKALLTTLYLNLATKEFTPKCNIITPPLKILQIYFFSCGSVSEGWGMKAQSSIDWYF